MKLYDYPQSPNAYKVRLLLSLLDLEYETETVDILEGEQNEESYRNINPRGEVPALVDDDVTLWDSQAILVYLAREYDGEDRWLPTDPVTMGRVNQWMALSAHEVHTGIARAVVIKAYDFPGDLEQAQETGREALGVLEGRLEDRDWLAADHATIADVINYPWVSLAPQGGLDLDEYPAVSGWTDRVESLPGYEAIG